LRCGSRSRRGAAAALLALAACAAPRETVVLLPDPDGKVGVVTVSNAAGSVRLESARESVVVRDAKHPPGKPAVMEEREVEKLFGPALRALPPQPARFTLYFDQDSTRLTPESGSLLAQVVEAIRARRGADTSVVGHTDTLGEAGHNYELSLRRAEAVADLLVAAGLSREALEVTSHGEENLLVPTADGIAEPRNRRVEVTVR